MTARRAPNPTTEPRMLALLSARWQGCAVPPTRGRKRIEPLRHCLCSDGFDRSAHRFGRSDNLFRHERGQPDQLRGHVRLHGSGHPRCQSRQRLGPLARGGLESDRDAGTVELGVLGRDGKGDFNIDGIHADGGFQRGHPTEAGNDPGRYSYRTFFGCLQGEKCRMASKTRSEIWIDRNPYFVGI